MISVFENVLSSGVTPLGLAYQLTVHISRPLWNLALVICFGKSVSKVPCFGNLVKSCWVFYGRVVCDCWVIGCGIMTPPVELLGVVSFLL